MAEAGRQARRLRVLVIGGYGLFGGLLARRLAGDPTLELIVAGRNVRAAQEFADDMRIDTGASCQGIAVDVTGPDFFRRLADIAPDVVVHTSGPFQGQDYSVAENSLAIGASYIDLADGRDFVANFSVLDERAQAANVALVTGASTLPALSSAVVDALADGMSIDVIDIGITPGNRTRRGLSTVKAILSYCGAPVRVWREGCWMQQTGWLDTVTKAYPAPVGKRRLSCCDVPDLELFPQRYAPVRNVSFRAGLELGILHSGMNLLALLRRAGIVADWARYGGFINAIGNLFHHAGSDAGAMHVTVDGCDAEQNALRREWVLVVEKGDGPYIPTLASAALVRRIARGEKLPAGAYPCCGILDLEDFKAEMQGLAVTTETLPR